MQTTNHVSIDHTENTAIITLRRPERRNALSLDLMRDVTRAFQTLGSDAGTRAIILAAEGSAFSAGHDLAELRGRSESAYTEIFDACVTLMQSIHAARQPVIAEVGGIATAAGCQLAATCDLVVASAQAQFATPGVRIGLFCSTPMVALSRAIGQKRAMEMLLTGEPIDAQTALDWGLANRVTPVEHLRRETVALARRIGEASLTVIGIGKRAFYEQIDMTERMAYDYTKDVMTRNALEKDAQEGISAFLEKRQPQWSE